MSLLKLALEDEDVSGNASHEIEYTIYGKIVDFSELLAATDKTHQEQWEIKIGHTPTNMADGKIRIRKTIPHITDTNNTSYVETIKLSPHDEVGKIEIPTVSSEDAFKAFKLMSDRGMLKDRYTFNIPDSNLKWEVDVFYLPGFNVGSGKYCEWVKIDLEVPNTTNAIPELPIKLTDVIIDSPIVDLVPEAKAIVDSLYKDYFITPNVFLTKSN